MKDRELIAAFLGGQASTTERIRSWIRSASQRWPGLFEADREDLEQDILVELLEALREDRFRAASGLRTYVRTYVHHKCIDRIRARKRRTFSGIEDETLEDHRMPSSDEIVDRQQSRELLRLLHQMPAQCRELWRYLDQGLSYREMSRILGVSEGALRVRVNRCRKKAQELREKLESDDL